MKLVRWKRFAWDLSKLSPPETALQPHFQIRAASKEDLKATRTVLVNSFSLDSAWSDAFKTFRGKLESQLEAAFARPPIPVLVIFHGPRIIAASLLSLDQDAENHLLSGPCVLSEYRSRGIGTALLYESLKHLQGAGVSRAFGVTRETSTASKFVYPKFGSTSEAYDFEQLLVGA